MAKLVAINNNLHQNVSVNPDKVAQHGAELNLVPVVLSEFSNLVVEHPIVLTKNGETGEFVCAALLGFESKENLFWHHEQWQGLYLPLQIQRQPFFISQTSNDVTQKDEYIICLDVESPAIKEFTTDEPAADYQRIFTNTGEDSQYFQQAKQCLAQLIQGEADNTLFLSTLQHFELLQPLSLEITFANEQSTRLNGLYTIDQDKLAALANEQLIELHQQQLLQPIYTMIASLGQIYRLIERKNTRLAR